MRAALEERIDRLALRGRVRLLGQRDDVEALLRRSRVFVHASYEEGMPNAVLEAMAMERPFVATTAGHLREVITPGEQGLLTPPDDADGFAGHLVRLLRDETSRRRMGAAGRATVVAQFDDRAIARKLVGLLDAVCRASGHIPAPALRAPQAAVTASAAE